MRGGINFRIEPDEAELIKEKMQKAGISNMSAYLRKMAIDGYVISLDLSDLKEILRLMRINSNNLNQYAKKANETGNVYYEDIKELQKSQKEIIELIKKVIGKLNDI